MEASLSELNKALPSGPTDNPYNRKEPDFVNGETVTSPNNYVATGVLGEISEAQTSSNGYQLEGAFYAQ
ncbi:hypothetical protein [Bdellovibrio sp. ArHS]|uniref:hypothetical protein n=1 Tax=Bdellovibrio sp. ArHS TaxID=1569284 RepID=UPI0005A443AD|nr:hypothetical protein [Bdellovibrio sp. ArHS]